MIYSRAAARQAREKHVLGKANIKASYQLFDRLEGQVRQVVADSGLPSILIYDHQQPGRTFGERYAAAFNQLFELGYERIISVGNDIPGLSVDHLLAASEELSQGRQVLGPTEDGGDYLIALTKEAFQKDQFALLPWRTDGLHRELLNQLSEVSAVSCLDYQVDVDSWESLNAGLKKGVLDSWAKLVRIVLRSLSNIKIESLFFDTSNGIIDTASLRGPPEKVFVWVLA